MIITSDYGSFPHSLLSTSKLYRDMRGYMGFYVIWPFGNGIPRSLFLRFAERFHGVSCGILMDLGDLIWEVMGC